MFRANKIKPSSVVVSVDEREKSKAVIVELLEPEQFGKVMKTLKSERQTRNSTKFLQVLSSWLRRDKFWSRVDQAKVNWTSI